MNLVKDIVLRVSISALLAFEICACGQEEDSEVGLECDMPAGFSKSDFDHVVNENYIIDSSSGNCDKGVCLTHTQQKSLDTVDTHHFCSCRCEDADGHKYDSNNDKYDSLCNCPGGTKCRQVVASCLTNSDYCPDGWETVEGAYCIPVCFDSCHGRCMPPSSSDEPWEWTCNRAE